MPLYTEKQRQAVLKRAVKVQARHGKKSVTPRSGGARRPDLEKGGMWPVVRQSLRRWGVPVSWYFGVTEPATCWRN